MSKTLEAQAQTAGLKVPKSVKLRTPDKKDFTQIITDAAQLANDFPEPAVGVAWSAVDYELMQGVMHLGLSEERPWHNSTLKNINLLQEKGHIDSRTRLLLDRMRNLRNAAVHSFYSMGQVSSGEACDFIALTEAITDQSKKLSR